MKKSIVIFSNPFGYGPTAHIIPVIKQLSAITQETEIIFAGSGLCREIIDESIVKTVAIDERNEEDIRLFLQSLTNPCVISCQNRFCIKAAKSLGIKSAFLDTLAWFWKEIPEDHLLADMIFWLRFPGIEKKIPDGYRINIVSGLIATPREAARKNQIMIHVGGAKYPLNNRIPSNYLSLLADALNEFATISKYDSILCVGGNEAMEFMQKEGIDKRVTFSSLSQKEFTEELSQSAHMFTTAGMASAMESFLNGVPTSFLLPLNLSHMAFAELLDKNGIQPQRMDWNEYAKVRENLPDMTEKDAIEELDVCAKQLISDSDNKRKFIADFVCIANHREDNAERKKLIDFLGDSGAYEVSEILKKEWDLI